MTRYSALYEYLGSIVRITSEQHRTFAMSLTSDIIQTSIAAKSAHSLSFKEIVDDCAATNLLMKHTDNSVKDLNKKRDAFVKKNGDKPEEDEKYKVELKELELKYTIVKDKSKLTVDKLADLSLSLMNSLKDDVRKSFVHYISLLKNIEYDVNSELAEFDKEEFTQADIKESINTLPVKEIKFELSESTAADLNASKTTKQSLTESMINMLGFNNVDIEDDKADAVAAH